MKYRKKPIVVEAVRWTGENREEIRKLCNNRGAFFTPARQDTEGHTTKWNLLIIDNLEGLMYAEIGDYIIKGVNGEFYPCKPDVFAKTYEAVEDDA